MKGILNINVILRDHEFGEEVIVEVRLFKWLIKKEHTIIETKQLEISQEQQK